MGKGNVRAGVSERCDAGRSGRSGEGRFEEGQRGSCAWGGCECGGEEAQP